MSILSRTKLCFLSFLFILVGIVVMFYDSRVATVDGKYVDTICPHYLPASVIILTGFALFLSAVFIPKKYL